MSALHIGVDVGGTKVLAGEVSDHGRVLRTARRRTPGRQAEPRALDDAVTEAVLEVADRRTVAAVGLSVAGLVDLTRGRVRFSTHLPWQEDDTAARLSARWGVPVLLDNDVSCAAVAELAHGRGLAHPDFLLVTIGTGIGGAIVHRGELWRGANGMAGEFGHVRVVPDGRVCECGLRGCLEEYASGNALTRLAGDAYEDGAAITAAATGGDPAAIQALASVGDWFGVGLAGLVGSFDPPVVVVGGGVSDAGELLLGPTRAALERTLVGAGHRDLPQVLVGSCGSAAGMVGAARIARTG
ncbi:ROK family protein [Nocardioides sp. cx-169]|uniref:ROK family protein n=1 Tax=Nocardioides sp. cx-169 TaxID=2899080 RepID=UPI001E45C1AE|nr:ROK family protein [Nocardioides sp. cx-169]MCD4534691.1 ROK family protein [Nocardioides sp. cx-169]